MLQAPLLPAAVIFKGLKRAKVLFSSLFSLALPLFLEARHKDYNIQKQPLIEKESESDLTPWWKGRVFKKT